MSAVYWSTHSTSSLIVDSDDTAAALDKQTSRQVPGKLGILVG